MLNPEPVMVLCAVFGYMGYHMIRWNVHMDDGIVNIVQICKATRGSIPHDSEKVTIHIHGINKKYIYFPERTWK